VSTTQAQAQVMRETATKFNNVNEGLQQMLRQLMSELEGLQSAWQGRGGTTFTQVKIQWANDQKALHQALSETADAILKASGAYSATDDSAASTVGAAAGSGRILPL
jgi:WXG100 family type VII secretion target